MGVRRVDIRRHSNSKSNGSCDFVVEGWVYVEKVGR